MSDLKSVKDKPDLIKQAENYQFLSDDKSHLICLMARQIEQLQKDNKAQQEVVDKLVEVLRGCACEYDNEWGDGSEGSGSKELRDLINSIGEDKELFCVECNGTGEVLQDDGSDSTGTLVCCESCSGTGKHNSIGEENE